jgi:endonuclease/exonuclease/phosphatase family metal-dependent hydrolase
MLTRCAVVLLTFVALSLPAAAEVLRVMTYNVRMPSEKDGPDYWGHRKDIATNVLREFSPDIFGTQELFGHQGDYFVSQIPEYSWFGRRRRTDRDDERMGVFYKSAKLKLIEEGDFWLSETPEVRGSSSWDMSIPRMVTWGLFESKATQQRFYFLNTHFPHRRQDTAARVQCARVITEFLKTLPGDVPLVMTGDFNSPADSEAHELLTQTLEDAWLTAGKKSGPEGTFHGFKGTPREDRIDWILYRAEWKVLEAEAITYHEGARYPSDHLPVLAVFETR